jgi:hypothetical protein
MGVIDEMRVVLVRDDENGDADFKELGIPEVPPAGAHVNMPDVLSGSWYWGTSRAPELPTYVGDVATEFAFPPPGGTLVGIFEWAANSAGKFSSGDVAALEQDAHDDPDMHRTNTIDYEMIISGKIDVELPGGKVTTLRPGDFIIMGGSAHAWKNVYEEPCRYLAIVVSGGRSSG